MSGFSKFSPNCCCGSVCGCAGTTPPQYQVTLGGGFTDGSVEVGYPPAEQPCSCGFLNDASAIASLSPGCTYDFNFGEVSCTGDPAFIFAQGFLVLSSSGIKFSLGFNGGEPPFFVWSISLDSPFDCTETYTLPFISGSPTICTGTPDAITVAPIF
jgi:hypothetical protein